MNHSLVSRLRLPRAIKMTVGMLGWLLCSTLAMAQERAGGEANLILPDLDMAVFFGVVH